MSSPIVPFRTQQQVTALYSNSVLALNNALQVLTPGDWYFKANAIGSVGAGLSQDLFILQKQIFPQTASGSNLDSMLANLNLAPRAGNLPAIGTILFVAAAGTTYIVAQGQIFLNPLTNISYACTQTTVVTSSDFSTTPIPIASVQTGTGFIAPIGTTLNASPPITDTTSANPETAFIVQTMADGVNSETDGEVANRIIFAFQNPPGAGSNSDFVNWAMQISGVTYAYVFDIFNSSFGLNIIYVTIFSGTFNPDVILLYDGIATPPSGPPTWVTYSRNASPLIPSVANYIQGVRPINNTVVVNTVDTYIIPLNINVTVTLATGFTLTTNIPSVGLTSQQLIQREVRRAIISIPASGVLVNGTSEIPISLIEQTLDAGLSATSVQTGIYAAILVDRYVVYNNIYTAIPVPYIGGMGSLNILDSYGNSQVIYDVQISYANIIVTLA
jgi:hypothetical protein